MGLAQPIRPTHSVIFIASAVILVAIIIRRADMEAAIMSGFFAHLAIDTGLFLAFSPVDFTYYDLSSYQSLFIVAAVVCAVAAGFFASKRRGPAEP